MNYEEMLGEIPFNLTKQELIERIMQIMPQVSKDKLLVTFLDLCYDVRNNQ